MITPFAPAREARHGCPRAVHGLAGELARRHELVLVHLEPGTEVDPALASRCVAVHALDVVRPGRWRQRVLDAAAIVRGRSFWAAEIGIPDLRRKVRSLLANWPADVVQVEHGVLGEVLPARHPALRVVTMHETAASRREFLPLRREGHGPAHRLDAVSAVRQERRILRLADAAVTFSERDRVRIGRGARWTRAELVTIPLGAEVPEAPLDPRGTAPPTLLFVGNFIHPPNLDAALRLATVIFPRVRDEVPDAVLEIVGPSPPAELRALDGGTVRVAGAVPSVVPHLDRAAVVVVPIRLGGGVRVKVLEALAAGKAVVVTPRAAEGIAARPGRELIVAENDEQLAAVVVDLLSDPMRRGALAGRAREWAERELGWTAMADRYEELYEQLERVRQGVRR